MRCVHRHTPAVAFSPPCPPVSSPPPPLVFVAFGWAGIYNPSSHTPPPHPTFPAPPCPALPSPPSPHQVAPDGSIINFSHSFPFGGLHVSAMDPVTLQRREIAFIKCVRPRGAAGGGVWGVSCGWWGVGGVGWAVGGVLMGWDGMGCWCEGVGR